MWKLRPHIKLRGGLAPSVALPPLPLQEFFPLLQPASLVLQPPPALTFVLAFARMLALFSVGQSLKGDACKA